MKKLVLLATALAMVSGSALAADMRVKAVKAPPPVAFDPWDIAFGARSRATTCSAASPSPTTSPRSRLTSSRATTSPRTCSSTLGLAGASISFPNRAAAEIDIYGGIRPTFGMFAFDFGVWGYLYPGGTVLQYANAFPGSGLAGSDINCVLNCAATADFRSTATSAKKNASFYEGYAKVNVTLNDMFAVGANEYYSPNFLNSAPGATTRRSPPSSPRRARPSAQAASACTSPASSAGSGSEPPIRSTARLHRSPALRDRSRTASSSRLQHLEHRRRLHLQGVHAGYSLLRHRPVEG